MDIQQEQLLRKMNTELQKEISKKTAELEAKNHELEIEAALEQVRDRTMTMKNSNELAIVSQLLFQQFHALGIHTFTSTYMLIEEENNIQRCWVVVPDGTLLPDFIDFPLTGDPILDDRYQSWKDKLPIYEAEIHGKLNKQHHRLLASRVPQTFAEHIVSQIPDRIFFYNANFSHGYLFIACTNPLSTKEKSITIRFAKVFQQTYIRFLDLQKAEAQAREALIEAALERVRARAMAMYTSQDLSEVVHEMRKQMDMLGQKDLDTCVIHLHDESTDYIHSWAAMKNPDREEEILDATAHVPRKGLLIIEESLEAYDAKLHDYMIINEGEKIRQWLAFIKKVSPESFIRMTEPSNRQKLEGIRTFWSFADFEGGSLLMVTLNQPDEISRKLLRRFSNVFGLAYKRFSDLKKAEAQARESRLQLALERVRARTMAMQRSDELADVATLLFQQVHELGIETWTTGFNVWQKGDTAYQDFVTNPEGGFIKPYLIDLTQFPVFIEIREAKQRGDEFFVRLEEGNAIKETYQHLMMYAPEQYGQLLELGFQFPSRQYEHFVFGKTVSLMFITYEPVPEAHDIFKRFGKVFEQTYTRFLDLQKAEAQAREAQIEAALERVRSKAMSMHKPEDLNTTIGTFYRELEQFSITPRRCGVGLLQKENRVAELSTMNTMEHGNSIEIIGRLKMEGHWVLEDVYDNWCLQKEYHPVLRGNEIKEYNQLLRPQVAFPEYPNSIVQYGYFFFFPEGGVYAWTEKEMKEDELNIYRRFTNVLSLTYKRYKDLKDAEAHAYEAVRRASLDRVRAEIASMRTTSDLERIQPLLWNELKTLGVPFIRCGVFIMDEVMQQIQIFLSTPDGKSIAAFRLTYNSTEQSSQIVNHWQQKQLFEDHMDEADFVKYTKNLVQQGAVASDEKYVTENRPTDLYLHFLPFLQGMLYVGNDAPLKKDELQLVQNLADAFSTAYARYEDFNRLESAKTQIEITLLDLKQAQVQLIHAEKMASLGELTAGIAHEIQNPLNFVNNFSEVSEELVNELKEELIKGDLEVAKGISDDVIENLQKIKHHGLRASNIVKGMLQHSRNSNGKKELTDINALADEFLRLAYHGLRAKDKSLPDGQAEFNVDYKTDFDPVLPKINVIPQDIGRVLLNLINNAFYAVQLETQHAASLQHPSQIQPGYKPMVVVSTKNTGTHVEIRVKDNGPGIPSEIKDKIFHPFFTTKPTGQGTGLGLSLSFDIVKAHGGELKMETKEHEGSEFIIGIPFI